VLLAIGQWSEQLLLVVYLHDGHITLIGTQEIRFGRKTDEIAKFSILDEKTKFTILDKKWPTDRRDRRKSCQILSHSLLALYHNAFTVGLKERMPRIIGMRMD